MGGAKKDTSEQTSQGMNANENDLKSGGRINAKLNTQGYYVSLWRENVVIYVVRETIFVANIPMKIVTLFTLLIESPLF